MSLPSILSSECLLCAKHCSRGQKYVIIIVPFPNASYLHLLYSSPYKNPCNTGFLIPILQMVKLELGEGKWLAQVNRAVGVEKGQDP